MPERAFLSLREDSGCRTEDLAAGQRICGLERGFWLLGRAFGLPDRGFVAWREYSGSWAYPAWLAGAAKAEEIWSGGGKMFVPRPYSNKETAAVSFETARHGGFSLIFMDVHGFSLIFIDFLEFSSIFYVLHFYVLFAVRY